MLGDQARRLRPYAIVVIAVASIALLPTRHDGRRDRASRPADAVAVGSSPTGPALDGVAAPAAAAPGAATPGAAATRSTRRGPSGAGNASAAAPAAAASGAGIGTPAALSAPDCETAAGKIKISLTWRPPCVVPFPKGADNGGATSQGVSADKIRVVLYNNTLGNPPTESADELMRKWLTSVEIFERFYRLWGRKIESIVVDETGPDEVAQRADAVKIASLKPFAVVGVPATAEVFYTELARRGIVSITNANVSVKDSLALAPYVWGTNVQPDELVALNAAEYAGKRLQGRPARWAGQADYQVAPRRFGLVHPETLDINKLFKPAFAKYGGALTDSISYQVGQEYAATWGERSQVVAARLKDRGVTTVIAITDLLFTGPLTHAATTQNWFPEWVVTGFLAQDLFLFAQTFNQAQWQHAFGSAGIPIHGLVPWPNYWVYLWYWGNQDNMDGPKQSEAITLFNGLHSAGPRLTPETFRDGLFAQTPSGGPATGGMMSAQFSFGRWGFVPYDDYNAYDDFDEVYWDPTARGPAVSGAESIGQYRHLNGGKRYLPNQWPTGEPAMFNPAGTRIFYETYPPGDKPPDYPCTGCPSDQS